VYRLIAFALFALIFAALLSLCLLFVGAVSYLTGCGADVGWLLLVVIIYVNDSIIAWRKKKKQEPRG